MIAMLSGRFVSKGPTNIIVDVSGVGFDVQVSLNTYSDIQQKESGSLFTYLKVAEDSLTLYGFSTENERDVFLKLISVSGVGASTARLVNSSLKPDDVRQIIAGGNARMLETVKGIGRKTAERIILELKDKMGGPASGINMPASNNSERQEALDALMALGISRAAADAALKKAMEQNQNEELTVEQWIKLALKGL